mmetsp:Transcript_49164/g.111515  ORF Transcript_49164/g.111515 Transcript_49164/m.111515 type:complete len:100 (-) Transcript_49164:56-355(-)
MRPVRVLKLFAAHTVEAALMVDPNDASGLTHAPPGGPGAGPGAGADLEEPPLLFGEALISELTTADPGRRARLVVRALEASFRPARWRLAPPQNRNWPC